MSCSGSHLASPCWYIYILHICSSPHHDLPTACLHYNKQDTQDTWILSQTSDTHTCMVCEIIMLAPSPSNAQYEAKHARNPCCLRLVALFHSYCSRAIFVCMLLVLFPLFGTCYLTTHTLYIYICTRKKYYSNISI